MFLKNRRESGAGSHIKRDGIFKPLLCSHVRDKSNQDYPVIRSNLPALTDNYRQKLVVMDVKSFKRWSNDGQTSVPPPDIYIIYQPLGLVSFKTTRYVYLFNRVSLNTDSHMYQ